MVETLGHHLIPLLSPPRAAGALGGKAHLAAVKQACQTVARIQGVLNLAGHHELAIVPTEPDFFSNEEGLIKARNAAWEAIRDSPAICWIILTRHPLHVPKLLPPDWIGKGYKNVCIALAAETAGNLDEGIATFHSLKARYKMLLVCQAVDFAAWAGSLKEIDWVVFSGTGDDTALADAVRSRCNEHGVAFLFHRTDGKIPAAPDGAAPPQHPFGPKMRLDRTPMAEISAMVAQIHSLFTLPEPMSPASHPQTSSVTNRPTDRAMPSVPSAAEVLHLDFEVMEDAADKQQTIVAAKDAADSITSSQEDFNRLDGIVRNSLRYFIVAGEALRKIRDRDLWRAGGHPSWADYCRTAGGLTKIHANRLIRAAQIAQHLAGVEPIGFTPVAESQMRPLCRLLNPEQCMRAWSIGVERAGGQPTARLLSDVVAELMADNLPAAPQKPNRMQLLIGIIANIRKSVFARRPPEQIEKFIVELEKSLRLTKSDPVPLTQK